MPGRKKKGICVFVLHFSERYHGQISDSNWVRCAKYWIGKAMIFTHTNEFLNAPVTVFSVNRLCRPATLYALCHAEAASQ